MRADRAAGLQRAGCRGAADVVWRARCCSTCYRCTGKAQRGNPVSNGCVPNCLVQDFYEDIFLELAKYGEVEYLNVCDNLAVHMVGIVYVKFRCAVITSISSFTCTFSSC